MLDKTKKEEVLQRFYNYFILEEIEDDKLNIKDKEFFEQMKNTIISELEPVEFKCIKLHYKKKKSYKEIANRYSKDKSTIRRYCQSGLSKIQNTY